MNDQVYTVGKWGEYKTYQCTACPFDSLELSVTLEHYAKKHAISLKTKRPLEALLFDAFGERIYHTPESNGS